MTDNIEDITEFEREQLKMQMVSLFWAIIMEKRKRPEGFPLQRIADALGVHKSQVSRWFNGLPNWESDTIADIGGVLGVELHISAREKASGKIFTASGVSRAPTINTHNEYIIQGQNVAAAYSSDDGFVTMRVGQ